MSMRTILIGAIIASAMSASAIAADDSSSRTTLSNPNNCKVVEREPGDRSAGAMSTTVTAGNGQVSASTNAPNAVTVHSGNGSATSSSVTTGSSGGGHTTVTTSNGDCVIYVNPGEKKDK